MGWSRAASALGAAVRSARIEASLHDRDVVPAAELERRLAFDADELEAVARMQAEGPGVSRGDPRHDRMVLEHPRAPDQLGEDHAAEPGAAVIPRDVDRILGGSREGRLRLVR